MTKDEELIERIDRMLLASPVDEYTTMIAVEPDDLREIRNRLEALARPVVGVEKREDIERDIRIAIWNAGMNGGMGQDLSQAFIVRAMAEPTMIRALAALAASPSPVVPRLPLMSAAFRTTVSGDGYRMDFKFPSIEALHAADDEWRAFRKDEQCTAGYAQSAAGSVPDTAAPASITTTDTPVVGDREARLGYHNMGSGGRCDWTHLREAVSEATCGSRTSATPFDPSYYPGHQPVDGINYNSLDRIVTAFVDAAFTQEAGWMPIDQDGNVCAEMLETAIGNGYPAPANKVDKCEHGKFGWEDCIACYDEYLQKVADEMRKLAP